MKSKDPNSIKTLTLFNTIRFTYINVSSQECRQRKYPHKLLNLYCKRAAEYVSAKTNYYTVNRLVRQPLK